MYDKYYNVFLHVLAVVHYKNQSADITIIIQGTALLLGPALLLV